VNESQPYFYNGMVSRTQLAVIDHNFNVRRQVATTSSGDERYNCVYLKHMVHMVWKRFEAEIWVSDRS